jgi:hypothetical protein
MKQTVLQQEIRIMRFEETYMTKKARYQPTEHQFFIITS